MRTYDPAHAKYLGFLSFSIMEVPNKTIQKLTQNEKQGFFYTFRGAMIIYLDPTDTWQKRRQQKLNLNFNASSSETKNRHAKYIIQKLKKIRLM